MIILINLLLSLASKLNFVFAKNLKLVMELLPNWQDNKPKDCHWLVSGTTTTNWSYRYLMSSS